MSSTVKISGVTIVKNAIEFDYPIVECIQSLLPIVDEMIVSIGDGNDNTLEVVQQINSEKIKIVHSVWDKSITTDGTVLAVETNKALQHVAIDSDWIFYLQADEVVHEEDYNRIVEAAQSYKDDPKVQGLLFYYKHFFGTFDYIGDSRRWYNYEIRMIKNEKQIQSYRDAQGFRRNGKKLTVKKIAAYIYHYGWVRTPHAQLKKLNNFYTYWGATENNQVEQDAMYNYMENVDSITLYKDTHPAVMQQRIAKRNTKLEYNTKKKNFSFKDLFLYRIEKITGKRLFDYKNYKIV